jgi:hypothetical protein
VCVLPSDGTHSEVHDPLCVHTDIVYFKVIRVLENSSTDASAREPVCSQVRGCVDNERMPQGSVRHRLCLRYLGVTLLSYSKDIYMQSLQTVSLFEIS